jgi:hypothetical protein
MKAVLCSSSLPLRRLRKIHDQNTWPQACPMTYGGFPAKCLMLLISATCHFAVKTQEQFVPAD